MVVYLKNFYWKTTIKGKDVTILVSNYIIKAVLLC